MNQKLMMDLRAFIIMLNYNEVNINVESLIHQFALDTKENIEIKDILYIAKQLKIKCKSKNIDEKSLRKLQTPFIYQTNDNTYNIVINITDEKVVILDTIDNKPKALEIDEFVSKWNRNVILMKKKGFMSSEEKFGFKWFLNVIGKFKGILVQILLAYFTLQIIGLLNPLFIQVIIDKVLSTNNKSTLIVLASGLVIALIIEMALSLAKDYVFTHTTSRIDMMLNSKLVKHLFRLPLSYFENRRVGDTIARVREVENIRAFLTGTPLTAILDMIFVIFYIIIMFFYSSTLSFIVLGIVPLIALIYGMVTPIFKKRLDEKFYTGAEVQSFMVESMTGIHTIKSFALEPKMEKKWAELAAEYTKTGFKTSKLVFSVNNVISFLQKIQDVLVVTIGATLVMNRTITVGELVAFRMISSKVSGPILRFVQLWQDYQQTSLSVKRISDIFVNPIESTDVSTNLELPNIQGKITFENVVFRYKVDQAPVIKKISFNIPPGKVVGIIGRSGSGKSTISKLVQRLYIPEEGKIYVDNIDISSVNPFWLRRQIGVVLQENFLFNGSVKENIAINNPNADFRDIVRVAKIAGAHEFIVKLQKGYDTIIGEKGIGLSGGQKQRLAIARALLTNPKILIFDEATSALDYESEAIIQENLKDICRGRTVLIIAHRLSTINNADYIMSVDKGNIIEYGEPKELLKNKNSFYRYLMEKQLGGDRNE